MRNFATPVFFVSYFLQGALASEPACNEDKIKDQVVQNLMALKEMPPHNLKIGLKFNGNAFLATYSYDFVQILGRANEKPVGIISSMAGYSRFDAKSCERLEGDATRTYSVQ